METFRPHPKTKAIRRERLAAVKRGDDETTKRLDSAKTPDPILGLDPHKHRAMIIAKYSVEIADRVDAEVARINARQRRIIDDCASEDESS